MRTDYTITKKEGYITILDDSHGIGIRFKEGDILCLYSYNLVVTDANLSATEEGIAILNDVSTELIEYAQTAYPNEFAEMPD